MAAFRLFLTDYERGIIGRSDFEAEDAVSAMKIAHKIFECCGDACSGYELWQGSTPITSVATTVSLPGADLSEFEQRVAVDTEIALHDSAWAIRESKLLIAAVEAVQGTRE
ncbi:MAG: hypothetical protein JOZ72_12630 [Alphaproteobacteria bacterium]|nr:hypothetical protein [Alphaproteobacteria bacterium]